MEVYEIVNSMRPLLERLLASGVNLRSLRNIGIYEDYRIMCMRGEKTTYIVASLAEKHKVSESSIKRIVKRFETKI